MKTKFSRERKFLTSLIPEEEDTEDYDSDSVTSTDLSMEKYSCSHSTPSREVMNITLAKHLWNVLSPSTKKLNYLYL